jgi:uncharacterized membrane protein (DUF2068 family)
VFFIWAALLHSGLSIFGFAESPVVSEAIVQGTIGLLLSLCAYGIWKRKRWSKILALVIHIIAIAGSLFGLLVVREADNNLNFFNTLRIGMLMVVFILLLIFRAKTASRFSKKTA